MGDMPSNEPSVSPTLGTSSPSSTSPTNEPSAAPSVVMYMTDFSDLSSNDDDIEESNDNLSGNSEVNFSLTLVVIASTIGAVLIALIGIGIWCVHCHKRRSRAIQDSSKMDQYADDVQLV